jgi:integrase
MAQVESPTNLDRWPHPQYRLLTLILVRCGLRASDAITLEFNCLTHDGQGAPYLRYLNHKMRREAAVPIDEDLQTEILRQQTHVADQWPGAHPHLFPALTGNANGQRATTYYSYRMMLLQWLKVCDIRDEHGDPVHLTTPSMAPHLRLPADQPRCPAGSRPAAAGPRIDPDDRPLRPDHRPDRPPAVGTSHQGQHQR